MAANDAPSNWDGSIHQLFQRIQDEAKRSRMYFHTWWGLVNRALPEYHSTINDWAYVDFFHAANSGFLDLVFVSLSKLFDRTNSKHPEKHPEVLGFRKFREALNEHGFTEEAQLIEQRLLKPREDVIRRIKGIRNKAIGHNEAALTREAVFERYGITPDEIRELIHEICDVLNEVGRRIGYPTGISDGGRSERAVIALLETLRHGRSRRTATVQRQ